MNIPEVHYAQSGEVNIAYSVLGDGPLDLIIVPGFISHMEYEWTEPRIAKFRRRLASFSRLILFDKRGTGMSDQVFGVPTLEQRMDDVRAVLEAVGSERAMVMGLSDGAALAALFAASYPQRTSGLLAYGASPYSRSDPDRLEQFISEIPKRWGTPELALEDLRTFSPSVAHEPELRDWTARWIRYCATPGAFIALVRMNAEIDVRHVLPAIHVPTLVLHRDGDRAEPAERGREFAAPIPTAKYVGLPGSDHYPWFGDVDSVVKEIERFARDLAEEAAFDRVLTTVLFTDLVGATERAAALGDREWRKLLDAHHSIVRANLARFRGREIDTAGDGFLASFDGPARAIRCATAVAAAVRELGLEIRAGLHTGECELMGDKLGGIAVHTGARVAAHAQPSEVLVSNTVKDLVAGSDIRFEDRGAAALKGVPGEWRLYAVQADAG